MTMRATRDALENPWQTVWVVDEAEPERGAQPSIVERDTSAALAEVAAVEAVVEAAQASAAAWPPENSPRWRWPFRWPYFYVTYGPRARAILDALARLSDARTDVLLLDRVSV